MGVADHLCPNCLHFDCKCMEGRLPSSQTGTIAKLQRELAQAEAERDAWESVARINTKAWEATLRRAKARRDGLERLRGENKDYTAAIARLYTERDEDQAQIKSLKSERDALKLCADKQAQVGGALQDVLVSLKDEVERLREALKEIELEAEAGTDTEDAFARQTLTGICDKAYSARAALGQGEE